MTENILKIVAVANPAVATSLQQLHARARTCERVASPAGPGFSSPAIPRADAPEESAPAVAAGDARGAASGVGAGHSLRDLTAPVPRGRRRARSIRIWGIAGLAAVCLIGVELLRTQTPERVALPGGSPLSPVPTGPIAISISAIAISLIVLASVLLCARVLASGIRPLQAVGQLDAHSATPLGELEKLAARSVQRLRSAYRIQLALSVAVAIVLGAAVIWAILMVSLNELPYATVLGSSGLGATMLAARWQPFDRVGRARFLAEQADILATGLRLRMTTIEQIADPRARQKAEWNAVKEYTEMALEAQASEHEQPEPPTLHAQPLRAA